jgi:hypothetical protein
MQLSWCWRKNIDCVWEHNTGINWPGYRLDDRGILVRFPAGTRDYFFCTESRPTLGSNLPPVQWILGPPFSAVKWSGHEADHSPSSSAKSKSSWSYTSTLPYVLMMWYVIKHNYNLIYLGEYFGLRAISKKFINRLWLQRYLTLHFMAYKVLKEKGRL